MYDEKNFKYRNLLFFTDSLQSYFYILNADSNTLIGTQYLCDVNIFGPDLCTNTTDFYQQKLFWKTLDTESVGTFQSMLYFIPDEKGELIYGFQ